MFCAPCAASVRTPSTRLGSAGFSDRQSGLPFHHDPKFPRPRPSPDTTWYTFRGQRTRLSPHDVTVFDVADVGRFSGRFTGSATELLPHCLLHRPTQQRPSLGHRCLNIGLNVGQADDALEDTTLLLRQVAPPAHRPYRHSCVESNLADRVRKLA